MESDHTTPEHHQEEEEEEEEEHESLSPPPPPCDGPRRASVQTVVNSASMQRAVANHFDGKAASSSSSPSTSPSHSPKKKTILEDEDPVALWPAHSDASDLTLDASSAQPFSVTVFVRAVIRGRSHQNFDYLLEDDEYFARRQKRVMTFALRYPRTLGCALFLVALGSVFLTSFISVMLSQPSRGLVFGLLSLFTLLPGLFVLSYIYRSYLGNEGYDMKSLPLFD
ncbi:hypothetical protein BC828DRAFT_376728 [Blastocladiella britannica]|nr:hypothetical protein BC828DRAFT_376728 [Blastocladiella britannica]